MLNVLIIIVVISALVMIVVGALMVPIVLKGHIKIQVPSVIRKIHGALGHAETNNSYTRLCITNTLCAV